MAFGWLISLVQTCWIAFTVILALWSFIIAVAETRDCHFLQSSNSNNPFLTFLWEFGTCGDHAPQLYLRLWSIYSGAGEKCTAGVGQEGLWRAISDLRYFVLLPVLCQLLTWRSPCCWLPFSHPSRSNRNYTRFVSLAVIIRRMQDEVCHTYYLSSCEMLTTTIGSWLAANAG